MSKLAEETVEMIARVQKRKSVREREYLTRIKKAEGWLSRARFFGGGAVCAMFFLPIPCWWPFLREPYNSILGVGVFLLGFLSAKRAWTCLGKAQAIVDGIANEDGVGIFASLVEASKQPPKKFGKRRQR